MRLNHTLVALAPLFTAAFAQAQTATFIPLNGYRPTDVTFVGTEAVVVGTNNSNSHAFRWTQATGPVDIGAVASGSNVKVSIDGSTIVADTVGTDAIKRASFWTSGGGWVQITGLGATSSGSETTVYGVNGDGSVLVGLGWISAGTAHAFRWTAATGSVDQTPPFSSPSSRANDVDGSGNLVVGWHNSLSGQRRGARWTGAPAVETLFTYVDPMSVSFDAGEASATNGTGTTVVGTNVFGLTAQAWRWDASTNAVTLLANLAGETSTPSPTDVTDDGSMVIGSNGGSPFGRKSIVWLAGQPAQSLFTWLTSFNNVGFGTFTEIGQPLGISRDGSVIVGTGSGTPFGQPEGWIVTLKPSGEPFCFGDGLDAAHTTACPCGNVGAPGRGCANSIVAQGGLLETTGSQGADDIVLHGSGMPLVVASIYLQGDLLDDAVFGDGVRCAGGTLLRLRTKMNSGGASEFPDSTDTITLSARGGVAPGSGARRYYQTYYRNAAAAFCPPATFNVSNGVVIDW